MPISAERISQDIEAIARFSEVTPDIGYSRPTFTLAWAAARDYVITEAKKIGCRVWIDAAGNVHAKPASLPDDRKVWLSGSHIDSVPTGGKYDGVIGIVAPLEVLRAHPNAPLELIIFAEEEGTTFNLGMLGSRTWAGTLDAAEMRTLKNRDGVDPITAGTSFGVDPTRFDSSKLDPSKYLGLIEVHAEQGVGMWKNNKPVAVVTAIAGRQQFTGKFFGTANHAGSTMMVDRYDALTAAARVILFVEQMARDFGDGTVATVGQISCEPNAINVIPAVVRFTVDFRSPHVDVLGKGKQQLNDFVAFRSLASEFNFFCTEELPPVLMNRDLCARLARAGEHITGRPLPTTSSGALHDAAILAPFLPATMLFVASKDGISHNPAEFSRIEDIALATQILAATVTEDV